jgi:hypothetical protein
VPVFKPSKELRTLVADADEALEIAEKAAAEAAQQRLGGPRSDLDLR